MFYNTGIATYVWILSNKKSNERRGKVQLINGINLCGKMRKSLGSKRNVMDDTDIATITRSFGQFEEEEARELDKPAEIKSNRGRQSANPKTEAAKTFASKIFATHQFGYRRITIERPLQESFQFSDERINTLRFAAKPLNTPMQWIYTTFGENWTDDANCKHYAKLNDSAAEIRAYIKSHFSELKEKHIKDLLDRKTWLAQKEVLLKAKQLQQTIGTAQHDDMNGYEAILKSACNSTDSSLDAKQKKQITSAVSWKNPKAEKVIKKVHKNTKANPFYGLFDINNETIEYKTDGDLRDNENVSLDPNQSVNALNEAYFKKEVRPHVPDAWIDASKRDSKDNEIGIVGYEIPFNRHFYQYQPPRDLEIIDAELDSVSNEIMRLLQKVAS
jgi:type I restriction enzyme M protein